MIQYTFAVKVNLLISVWDDPTGGYAKLPGLLIN